MDKPCRDTDVRRVAMDLLARREHSRRELKEKLNKRFHDNELIDEQIDRLAEERLQSDERYAESFLRQRINRGHGPVRIRQEMRQKGIEHRDIDKALSTNDPDWLSLAEQAWKRKFGAERAEDIREKARRDRFMRYRGFAADHYRHLIEH